MYKLKIDSLDKKPKLWNLLIIAIVTVAASVVLALAYGEKATLAITIIFDVFYTVAFILLIRAFLRQLRYNPYSYNTIFYFGFAVFDLFVLVTTLVVTIRGGGSQKLISTVLYSARNYIVITSPFILFFSVALCISNISLMRHEGRRPINTIGIILSVLMVGGAVLIFLSERLGISELFINIFAAFYLYFECLIIGTMVANAIAVRIQPDPDRDFIIILGCALRKDGTPTPLLKGRVDRAVEFYNKQKEETGKEATFITSGGRGHDEVASESAVMKKYLLDMGIPESSIIEEDQSRDTNENMKFSKQKIEAVNPQGKVTYATTNFHVFRSGIYARRAKMKAIGIGAKTKWYFWPNASVRELGGLLIAHKVKQAIIILSIIAFYTLLTLSQ